MPAPPLAPPLPEPRPMRPMPTAEPIAREPVEIPPTPPVVAGPPPLTTTDRKGRPRLMSDIGSEERIEAERQLMDELRNYEPKKRSRLRMIGMSALRGLAAGPGGALSGALWGGLASVVDPTLEDKQWQAEQMAQSQQRAQQAMSERRFGLQDELLEAQVNEARRAPRPRLVPHVQPDGTEILVPEQVGVVTGRPRPATPRIAVDVPGVGPIETTPEAAIGYYGQVGAREATARERESTRRDEMATRNAQRQALLDEAKTLRGQADNAEENAKALDANLKSLYEQMEKTPTGSRTEVQRDAAGNSISVTIPSARASLDKQVEEIKAEQRRLREQAQGWRTQAASSQAKGEAIPVATIAPNAPPPPPGVTEASVRAEARRRNENEDAAVQRARSFGWIR